VLDLRKGENWRKRFSNCRRLRISYRRKLQCIRCKTKQIKRVPLLLYGGSVSNWLHQRRL